MRHLLFACALALAPIATAQRGLGWEPLPALPDAHGFAGAFAGVSDRALLVAGGANFPDGAPWDGGTKVWHDRVFVLDDPTSESWREAGHLPRPLAYGVSLTTPRGVLCVGGSDAAAHHADCFLLRWNGDTIDVEPLPALPRPLANMGGAVLGGIAYVVGGTHDPTDTVASRELLALSLDDPSTGWRTLEPIPGPGRILPVIAAQARALFVVSGASLAGTGGAPVRTYLTDGWRYVPARGWAPIADPPRAVVAAPSPAPALGASHFVVVGGDDGALVDFEPKSSHPGFPRRVLSYDATTDTWVELDPLPAPVLPPVTAPVVRWRDRFVIPSGEVRPAVRSPQVLAFTPTDSKASFGWLNWIVVAVYLTGMIGVGVFFMRRESAASTEAYFRGSQRVPAWVAGLSIFATMLSALTFMGIPARAYQTDVSWYLGQLPILLITPLVVFCYLPFFRRLDLRSAYEYLERRFDLRCRLFASLSFVLFHVGRIALVLYLPALALAAVSDIDVVTAILAIGVLCLVYTVIGGIEAVVWTDAIQALVLLTGALLCLVLAVVRVDGGIAGVVEIATRDAKLFENLRWSSFDVADGTASVVVLFVAFFFNSLVTYTSSQDVVQRYVTTRDLPAARRSLWISMWMSLLGSMVFFALGVAIYAFYKTRPEQLDPALPAADSILPFYVMQQLPAGLSGMVIAAIFAASQSTISSSLNSIATAFAEDFDARLLRPGRPDRDYLRRAKVVVVVAGSVAIAVAVWMANAKVESAFKTFNTLIGLTAGSLGGLFALGVFTRRAHGTGALVGAFVGLALVLALRMSGAPVTGLLYAFVGFGTCFVVGVLASLVSAGRRDASLSVRG